MTVKNKKLGYIKYSAILLNTKNLLLLFLLYSHMQ